MKQVPQVAGLRFDAERRRAVREGVPLVLNAFDRRALGEATRLRGLLSRYSGSGVERGPSIPAPPRSPLAGEVVAVTMGPPQARAVLEECLVLGVDRALHLCDPDLAGSDALATARALAAAIRPLEPDLVLCGQRSVDAGTSQVGPALAELLGLPQATAATRITPAEDGRTLVVERLCDEGYETLAIPLPCLITAAERLHRPEAGEPPPRPSHASVEVVTAAEVGLVGSEMGEEGSATRVLRIREVEVPRRREVLEGASEAAIRRIAEILAGMHGVRPRDRDGCDGRTPCAPTVLVVAECLSDGSLHPAAPGLVRLGASLGGRMGVLLAGAKEVDHAETLRAAGAEQVRVAEEAGLGDRDAGACALPLARAIVAKRPDLVLMAATSLGRDLAPRVAARLGLGLVSECEDVRLEGGELVFVRPAHGGMVLADVTVRTRPAMATMRAAVRHGVGAGSPRPPPGSRACKSACGRGDPAPTPADLAAMPSPCTTILSAKPCVGRAGLALDTADIVVGVGTGLGGSEHLPAIERLAVSLGAAVGGTRKVVDLGWLPPHQQIGLSGRQIAPRVYLAIGVRGSFNHAVGIRRAGTVVAINTDRRAEIFGECDLGVVADWREIVLALTESVPRSTFNVGYRPR